MEYQMGSLVRIGEGKSCQSWSNGWLQNRSGWDKFKPSSEGNKKHFNHNEVKEEGEKEEKSCMIEPWTNSSKKTWRKNT